MKKLWNAFLAVCLLSVSQLALANNQLLIEPVQPVQQQQNTGLCKEERTNSYGELKNVEIVDLQLPKNSVAKSIAKAAEDSLYTDWEPAGYVQLPESVFDPFEEFFNEFSYSRNIGFTYVSKAYVRSKKDQESIKQCKICRFLGYNDIIIDYDTQSKFAEIKVCDFSMPVPEGLESYFENPGFKIYCDGNYSPETSTFSFNRLIFLTSDTSGYWATEPFEITFLYKEEDFNEWESLGVATITDCYIENSLNDYCQEGDEPIKFEYTTEVFGRTMKTDPAKTEFKFTKFLGYNDVCFVIDSTTKQGSLYQTDTGMPVPSGLAEDFGTTSLDAECGSVAYYPELHYFYLSNFNIYVDRRYHYLCSLEVRLQDYKGYTSWVSRLVSGGTKSTDKSITIKYLPVEGCDHLRYAIRKYDFSISEIDDLAAGKIEFQRTDSLLTFNFTEGCGNYYYIAVAMDADDNFNGSYRYGYIYSNIETEGTWESIGRGTWHYHGSPDYTIYDPETGSETPYEFPTDKFTWEVEIEKRTDVDGEYYRVVNPYTPECPLADSFEELITILEGEDHDSIFSTDDTYWAEFELKDGKIKSEAV